MNNNNTILNLNQKSINYVVTNNKNTISLLKNSGSFILYEPNSNIQNNNDMYNDIYRELWISNYFIASGYGAKTRTEQEKLSYIASRYSDDYNYLDNNIKQCYSYSYNLNYQLDLNKVTKGFSYTYLGDDISYNVFNFGNQSITLNELYDKFKTINILYPFELINVIYTYKFINDTNEYHDISYVPIGRKLEKINITFVCNTRDSGGINQIYIKLNKQNSDDKYVLSLANLNKVDSEIPKKQNVYYEFTLSKYFGENDDYQYIIQYGVNNIIDDIQITTLPGSSDNIIIKPLDSTILDNVNNSFPTYIIGSTTCYVYCENLISNKDKYDINNYYSTLIIDNQLKLSITENYINKANNEYSNIQDICILINQLDKIKLVDVQYYDDITCKKYDIIDFILINEKQINDINYIEYTFKIDNNQLYNSNINPPFLHITDNTLYFNTGYIMFNFITSNVNITENNILKNTTQYWISYQANNDNLPL